MGKAENTKGTATTRRRSKVPHRWQAYSSGRWISPIMIRLLCTLNPRREGSIWRPFFPFFLEPFPPGPDSDRSSS